MMYKYKYMFDQKTKKVTVCDDLLEWVKYMETADRIVAKDKVEETTVLTVFLGINQNWGGGDPILFQTMIFGGEFNKFQEQHTSYEEALKGHKRALKKVKGNKS